MMEDNGKLAYSVAEAAVALGISRCLAYELVHRGVIPSVRLGERRLVIPRTSLEMMLRDKASKEETCD